MVAEIGDLEVGLLVDDVIGVLRMPTESIQQPPKIVSAGSTAVRGVVRHQDRLVVLLDADLILMQQETELLRSQTVTA